MRVDETIYQFISRGIPALRFVIILACAASVHAQETSDDAAHVDVKSAFQFSQTAFSNWAAGGQSSLAVNGDLQLHAHQRRGNFGSEVVAHWLVGFFKTEDVPVRKINDHLNIASVSGYHVTPSTSVGVMADLTTQVAPSYIFDQGSVLALGGDPEEGIKTGNLLSPGHLELGVGVRYVKAKPFIGIVAMPVMVKQTYILDEDVRRLDKNLPSGLYGNDGKTVRSELGGTLKLTFRVPLVENVTADGQAKLFANYADQDVDSSALLNLTGKINEHLSASVHTTLLYDNDVDTDPGKPGRQQRVQIREVLGVNLVYAFSL